MRLAAAGWFGGVICSSRRVTTSYPTKKTWGGHCFKGTSPKKNTKTGLAGKLSGNLGGDILVTQEGNMFGDILFVR